jgi:DNA repair protein RadA/Sms
MGRDWVVFGEIGLVGEVRGVSRLSARLAEAASMGFKRAMIPKTSADKLTADERFGVEIVGVRTVDEALDLALD